jgi:mannose-1-phosphate guanylyltransferase
MGVKPTYPATGFGYIKVGVPFGKVFRAERFVEKPNEAMAKKYLKSGRYVWNAGMFVWKVSTMKSALQRYAPQLIGITPKDYENLPKISFDYAVMEKADNVLVTSGDFGWDDVGGYDAFDRYFPHDARGNVREGPCTVVEADDNICIARSARISLLGVKNLVVVTTPDAVLVADKSRVTELKKLFR